MTTPDTELGLRKIDPETDEWREGYDWVNDNADQTTALIKADRVRLAGLEAAAVAADPDAIRPTFGTYALNVGEVRVRPGNDARYAAFPSAAVLADGRFVMVWREGADHITARDGVVRAATSADNGLTWSAAETWFVGEDPGVDLRDPTVSTSVDKQTVYVTYIKGTAALNAAGFFLRISTDQGETFGAEIRIDPHPYSAGTAPIVTLPNGQLLATWYGKETLSQTWDSSFYSTSADGGKTWGAPKKVADGVAAGRDYQEPYAAVRGNVVVIMFRYGNNDRIGITRSLNGGATWSTADPAFVGTGRPSCLFTSNGSLVVVYRNLPGGGTVMHGMVRRSRDNGVAWEPAHLVERTNPNMWLYSGPVEVARGVIFCPSAVEVSSTVGRISCRYLTEGGGVSPYGDVAPSASERAASRTNTIAVADSFDRANGPLGQSDDGVEWFGDGVATIVDGQLQDTNNAGAHLCYINAVAVDYEIEAEMQWVGNPGMYIVFRLQNTTNYYMFGIETAGTTARLYRVVNGTATQLATANLSFPAGVYHKLKVSSVGDIIRCYVEDVSVIATSETGGTNLPWVGFRTGAGGAITHRARNLVVRRRGGVLS